MYILTQVTLAELEKSTEMFRQLADPNGANNALSQVLYGLALRHGWGCPKSEEQAVTYLSAAASNSASIESQALQAGMKKGGAAKGELVLAIFELGNCFRNGWGVKKDPAAARQYFETAANLGDTDAMNEVAWCYLEGFGGKKDKRGYKLENFCYASLGHHGLVSRASILCDSHHSCAWSSWELLFVQLTNPVASMFSSQLLNIIDWPNRKEAN
ncbi:unnamed protein product [Aspergillus oryzae RIB40]|uniref:DNA, SC005 n=2 Tax=Aspergillus oryzae TaxID=5062 RepID=Q2US20_ASPOR|nr:unnamed protein product [Aspergillus oryzae RIB40]EIT74033.1 hypothetical protein Ao3042_10028 [Aspergillus oryzae 3.042]BAE55645.1 unnamed protein product [Aspergillus oryzae RIB40]|eukprot:EIT74033.1 hypothetical protein Ao3042_10028 [Aspergillus oryzae 3.042]